MYRNCQKRVRRVHMHTSIQCTNIYIYLNLWQSFCCQRILADTCCCSCFRHFVHDAFMSLRKMQLPSITWNRQREVAISRVGGSPTLATNYWLMDKIDRKRLPSQGKAPFHPSFSNKLHFLEKAMWNFQDVRLDGPVAPFKARTFHHKNSTKFSEKWVPPRGIHL